MIPLLFQLSCQLNISQIHKVFFGYMRVQVLVVCFECIKRMIIKLTLIFVVIHYYRCDVYLYLFFNIYNLSYNFSKIYKWFISNYITSIFYILKFKTIFQMTKIQKVFFVLLLIQLASAQQQQQINIPFFQESILDKQLDPLETTKYKQIFHREINVSVGEQLRIVFPSFDSQYRQEVFTFKELDQDQYALKIKKLNASYEGNSQFEEQIDSANKELKKSNQSEEKIGKPIKTAQLPLKCSFIPSKAQVYETISKITDQSGSSQLNFQNKHYVHVSSRQLLYILNDQNMLLSAYYYNDMNIKFLASFQLPINHKEETDQQNQQSYSQSHSSVSMAVNSKETELYVISDLGVWSIQTKTFLTNIKALDNLSGFDPLKTRGIDKLIHGTNSILVGMKKMSKIFVIPEPKSSYGSTPYIQINRFKQQQIFPQDIAIQGSYLFVLDVYKGIYVYKILSDLTVDQVFKVGLDSYGGNYRMHVFQINTVFINFNDYDGSKVVQINVDVEGQTAELVRYFKNDEFISFMQTYSVLTSSTGFYLSEINSNSNVDQHQVQSSAESLLFIVSNYQEIHIFPFNIDPRTITSLYNGVKVSYPQIKEIIHLFGDRFIFITEDTVDYVKLSILKPQASCKIGSEYNPDYSQSPENLQITVVSNVSTCEYRNKLLKHKVTYNENCELTTKYLVHLKDPQTSTFRRIITYGIVLVVLAVFILGLFCLIQWRNEKLVVLSRLKDQIVRFRNRHKRMQPFVEDPIPARQQIQMEVPQDIEYIPNQEQN